MELWTRQIKLARYMLLGTVIVTALNIVFLLTNTQLYISYCAALPYYLVWLGKIFDNGLYLGAANGEFAATGMVMAGVVLAGWLLVWWMARSSRTWLKIGMIAVVVDLLIQLVLSVVLFSDIMGFFWEFILHGAVIWEISQGLKAWSEKTAAESRQVLQQEEAVPEPEYV